jgi:triacylglycerol lipase
MITPQLRAPILFAHGLLGFDELRLGSWVLASYFPGIPEHLRAAGNRVFVSRVSPLAGIADRAGQLKAFLDQQSPHEPVHIIAHSMGGLDARYLISKLGMADRVLTLTTVGTPHYGTAFADWGIQRWEGMVRPFLDFSGLPYQAFYDLTTASCRTFNQDVPDAPGVRYFSVAGRFGGAWLHPQWALPQHVVTAVEGPNDGIVSVTSATYGESCDVWDGDHVSLVNQANPMTQLLGQWRDRTPDYANLVRRLSDEGY